MTAPKLKSTVNRLLDLANESELFNKNAEGDAYVRGDERSRARKDLSGLYHRKFGEAAPVGVMSTALDILQSRALERPTEGKLIILEGPSYLERLRGDEEIEPDPRWPKVVKVLLAGVPGITGKCTAGSRGFMAELHEDDRLIPIDDVLGDNGEIVYPAGKDLRTR